MDGKEYIKDLLAGIKKPSPVVSGEEFCFASVGLAHGHINGMTAELVRAGAKLLYVCDPENPDKAEKLAASYGAQVVDSTERIYEDKRVRLIASADVPCRRAELGIDAMRHGLDYFVDKGPFTSLAQLEEARKVCAETGRYYFVDYSERLHSECSILAGYLIDAGYLGRVVNIIGTGPHRISLPTRPSWFFEREKYGGIITDIGSHQAEQFLFYAGCDDAEVISSAVGNLKYHDYPELDDFGEMHLRSANGVTGYHRVDWYTPDGLGSWGDGRCYIEGTEGFIEMRKNIDLTAGGGNRMYLVTAAGEFFIDANGTTGLPFFGEMILDCLNRTENSMTMKHTFAAASLALTAQDKAAVIRP